MLKREQRVINAFINCVEKGEYSYDYACILIEDSQRYGYLTDEAKEEFYSRFEAKEKEDVEELEDSADETVEN